MPSDTFPPSFWLLNCATRWGRRPVNIPPKPGDDRYYTFAAEGISTGGELSLAALPDGPLGANSSDGSIGQLAMPRGMALDAANRLYLLVGHRILRWQPGHGDAPGEFVVLQGIGGKGEDSRQFRDPRTIAIVGSHLYVADTGHKQVKVFGLDDSLPLIQIIDPPAWDHPWLPVDVAVVGERVYLLDGVGNQLFRHLRGTDRLVRVRGPHEENPKGRQPKRWDRLAPGKEGRLAVLDADATPPVIDVFDPAPPKDTLHWSSSTQPGEIRELFPLPPVRMYENARPKARPCRIFCLPASLARECDPKLPPPQPPSGLPPFGSGDRLFTPSGQPVYIEPADSSPASPVRDCDPQLSSPQPPSSSSPFAPRKRMSGSHAKPIIIQPADWLPPLLYRTGKPPEKAATWVSPVLDAGQIGAQWHRLEIELNQLPPGAQVQLQTLSAASPDEPPNPQDPRWSAPVRFTGPEQTSDPTVTPLGEPGGPTGVYDALVQSREGQWLWVKVSMTGDGFRSPALHAIRAYYPRRSYLNYLPAVLGEDDDSRWFLQRFLSIFQTEWDRIEREIGDARQIFDPAAAPAEWLDTLARWFGLPLEGTWSPAQKRAILQGMPAFFSGRGTPAGLRRFVQAYLQAMTDLSPDEQGDYPVLIEGFKLRQRLFLSQSHGATFGDQALLWGPDQVGRLQLDRDAQVGQGKLVSTGDPERDLFHEYAHRFRVYLPAAWVRTADDERMLVRALEAEKPAHALYDVCLVEPRFRVGIQSTIGLDTIVGADPVFVLGGQCDNEEHVLCREPANCLGYDSVLAAAPPDPPTLDPAPPARIGTDTRLR